MTFSHASSRPQVLLGAGLALLLAIGGCSGDGGAPPSGPPALGSLPTVRSYDDIRLPLDHYTVSREERMIAQTAVEELVAECMADRGFPGYPVSDLRPHTLEPAHGNQFGLVSEPDAAAHGFTPPWISALEKEGAAYAERFEGWGTPEVMVALNGTSEPIDVDTLPPGSMAPFDSPGGCREQGRTRLYELAGAEAPQHVLWFDQLQGQSYGRMLDDPRLGPVTEAWAACMTRKGYDYAEPHEPLEDASLLDDPERERVVAVDLVRCTHESRLADTMVALVAAYQERIVDENAEALADHRSAREAVLETVRSKGMGNLGGHPGGPPPG